ncbi:dehydrogenase [Streptomyces mashuensis]|uniref:Dehydrogenase n=1 Tax=Streptomyces mashuensis TaxID=33904 RepID=A0A919EFW3_9ACTN|nr:NAD(P)-binding domain-containing protein [Streptomyces mashuensis]GHF66404.1 dehydrogenase [Streptomyces mashuensis]
MTTTNPTPLTLLGLGAMGTALAHTWLTAGHPLTIWNRSPHRAQALTTHGATAAPTPADAIAANQLIVVCLLDDASVEETLTGTDLTGKDIVNLTTSTPDQARTRATWAEQHGARYLDGGIMAVPPMIGNPDTGAYVLYSGNRPLYDTHWRTLAVPASTTYLGENPGHAALYDVALLSGMYGMIAGITHAYALLRADHIPTQDFAPLLTSWLTAMTFTAPKTAHQLDTGDYTKDVVSNLAMQAGADTLLRTAQDQGVSTELLAPFVDLMKRRVADGHGDEEFAGLVDLLRTT